jgi:4-amino-4-deoxy-L-arabinose transferase-like glycosyltransferase
MHPEGIPMLLRNITILSPVPEATGMAGVKTDMRDGGPLSVYGKAWMGAIIVVVFYALLRVATIPPAPETTSGFSHDSAYFTIVARNLLAGRGYVNDALWRVSLNPDALPMPYHNGNPLYPTLMAAVTFISGADTIYSGFLISALSSCFLVIAIIFMVKPYVGRVGPAVVLGFCGAIFPPVLENSFHLLADSLFVALFFAFVAAVIRMDTSWGRVMAGVFLGLTWLARAQVILALPALLLYMILRCGLRRGVSRFVMIGVIALVIASPWLIHTQMVWGNPFRSDASHQLMQDYHVMRDGQAFSWDNLQRYWHSPHSPQGVAVIMKENPWGFAIHTLRGIPIMINTALTAWSMADVGSIFPELPKANMIVGILLGAAVLFFCLNRRWLSSPEVLAVGLYAVIMFLVFAIRAHSFEMRYFNSLSGFFAVFAAGGCLKAWDAVRHPKRPTVLRFSVAVLSVLLLLWVVPGKADDLYRETNRTNNFLVGYRPIAAEVDRRFAKGRPVVVGTYPYYYTLVTSGSALSFPEANDQFLLDYMDKYNAEYLLLTPAEMALWRPAWLSPSSIPAEIELVTRIGTAFLFRKK